MFNGYLKLENGVSVPQLALGTWQIDDEDAVGAVKTAIGIGYRHFDTAQIYGNERGVGEGVRKGMRAYGVTREQIFVTSKIAPGLKDYRSASDGIDETLLRSGLDYLDLMLIHSPRSGKNPDRPDDRCEEGNREAWRALEDAYTEGKLRAIGVSNFTEYDIENLWENARVKPMIDQIYCNISNTPEKLIEYCHGKGIVTEAYSPIARGAALKDEKILQTARKYGVFASQICIRYCIQLGMIAIPKTSDPEHMKTNAELDFVISDEDMEYLKEIAED